MFPKYRSFGEYIDGSTKEVITVSINFTNDLEEAKRQCASFATEHKYPWRTWIRKADRTSKYCVVHYGKFPPD